MFKFNHRWKRLVSEVARIKRNRHLERRFNDWKQSGGICPMAHLGKRRVIEQYIREFSPEVFIETGTYKGDMIYAALPYLNEIYSIELDETYFRKAKRRFAGYPNVHILQGQSGEVLPEILKDINKPCFFWLDAHWSGGSTARGDLETPIMQEIKCILNHTRAREHVILIDDARCFTGENDYPTLEGLERFIRNVCPDWVFEVKDDIIRTHSCMYL